MGRSDEDRDADGWRGSQVPVVKKLRADWIDPEAWRRIAVRFNLHSEGARKDGDGCRLLQVLQGIVGGLEDAEIAAVLGIQPCTVSGYIGELFRRMQTDRRCRAVAKAWRASLNE